MPLRDHFHPPFANRRSWEGFHGQWPTMIVIGLSRKLPQRYVAEPQVHLGSSIEIDVATYDEDDADFPSTGETGNGGGVATAVWAPPKPTLAVASDLPDLAEYEVRVYDSKSGRRLVAAVEIVSPANKDRPEHRRAFVAKCAALLQNRVSVAIVDLVTTRDFNLYSDLMELIGPDRPVPGRRAAPLTTPSPVAAPREEDKWLSGDLVASPGRWPAAADAAALARRQPRGASRAGSQLRGDMPHPAYPLECELSRWDHRCGFRARFEATMFTTPVCGSGCSIEGVAEGDDTLRIGGLLCFDSDFRDATGLVQCERWRHVAAQRASELREEIGLRG